jgi:hypothetical protein
VLYTRVTTINVSGKSEARHIAPGKKANEIYSKKKQMSKDGNTKMENMKPCSLCGEEIKTLAIILATVTAIFKAQ